MQSIPATRITRIGVWLTLVLMSAFALGSPAEALAPPPPPKPPLVSTGYAPELTESTAVLRGSVNPRGSETSYDFEYGPTAAYGAHTPVVSAGAGTQELKVSQTAAGLTAYTAYHYRLVATSAAGTAVGADRVFTTKKTPLVVTIAPTRNPVVFGSRFAVEGAISGTDAASQLVVLQAMPFPYNAGFAPIAPPEQVDATGKFSIPVADLKGSSELRVVTVGTPNVVSPVIRELVAVHVSLRVHRLARRGYVRFSGTVSPADVGATVALQWIHHKRYVTVGATRVRRGSATTARFSAVVRIRHKGRYRAFVRTTLGKLLSHYSAAVRLR